MSYVIFTENMSNNISNDYILVITKKNNWKANFTEKERQATYIHTCFFGILRANIFYGLPILQLLHLWIYEYSFFRASVCPIYNSIYYLCNILHSLIHYNNKFKALKILFKSICIIAVILKCSFYILMLLIRKKGKN